MCRFFPAKAALNPCHATPATQTPAAAHRCRAPHCADPEGLRPLKFLATRWHIAFSSMLVLGLLLSTLM